MPKGSVEPKGSVGKVLKQLEDSGVADNTVVFFTGDNGGLSTSEGSPTSNLPLRGGKGWVYEGGIREPWIVRWPGVTRAGGVSGEPICSTMPSCMTTMRSAMVIASIWSWVT